MYTTPLDKALGHWFVDSGSTWSSVSEHLGITPRAMRSKRCGKVPFTAREVHEIAALLDVSMDEAYGLLPEQSH